MSPIQESYQILYKSLNDLREHLHLSGRIDDSNAKLDEVSKVLAICVAVHYEWIESSNFLDLVNTNRFDSEATAILSESFQKCIDQEKFQNSDGSSIFGALPVLNIQEDDNEFALLLARTIYTAFSQALTHAKNNHSFDLVNEAFGHFVRDNFRGNIEDAQYMTPPEVVDFICDWAIFELDQKGFKFNQSTLTVLDPSCGVGSFLASFYRKLGHHLGRQPKKVKLIGQDKVDRMVRLSKINMMLFGSDIYDIEQGNSLIRSTRLNKLNGKVDLIITNPPFGANISASMLAEEPKNNYPLFHNSVNGAIDSELAFIDREMSLLKEGGSLFIVVPDSTISSLGAAETLRARLMGVAKLKGVIELPAVTFAQAGTRTKTSILYLEKNTKRSSDDLVTMATIEDLGFQVSMRKGVAVKKYEGKNQLEVLSNKLLNPISNPCVISEDPSCTLEYAKKVENGSWTASHYSAKRALAILELSNLKGYSVEFFSNLVNFETKKRRRLKEEAGSKCISVLHVIGDGVLDFEELLTYSPKTKGNVCFEGDILISKINPRIPRIIVVPKLDFPTTCSNEFEVVTPKEGIDPYWVCYMLLEKVVQDQIQSLTSGTSSSHNRIKTTELEIIKIPVPKTKATVERMSAVTASYKKHIDSIVSSLYGINKLRRNSA